MSVLPVPALAPPPPVFARRRLAVVLLLVAVMVASLVAAVTPAASAADPLLSQGRPVTASSVQNASFPASAAVDGDLGTRWSSAAADPQWIRVDLGATATISQVALNWETAYATAYQIQVSADDSTWTTVYATTTSTGGTQTLTVTGSGRYVRVYTTARATQYGVSLWEFRVYGTTTATGCDTAGNAALNRPATASSTENAGFPASAAVDGNLGTRWSSAAADPQWIQVDLGSSRTICRVDLSWEAAYATAYQIQVSDNGSTWTTVYATTTSTGGTQTLTVTGSGRYVRVYGTARATVWGYSLWEFAVRTSAGPPPSTPPPSTPPPSSPPPGGDVLLSYGKPAFASSYQDDGACWQCYPSRAFDLDPASRWATSATTGWVDPGWIYVDLGATATVHRVVLQWDPAYATAYQIQTSNDAGTWTTIYSTTSAKGFKQTLNVTGTGRYVRMYGTARSSTYGYSLWEFQVYGTGGAPTAPPAAPPDPTFPATRLVFADEFNGAAGSKPDPAKWTIDPGTGQNGELQYYTDNANAAMNGSGQLVMEARRETAGGRSYTSHRMNTSNRFHVQYGRVEARIKVPKGNGFWPAFWMMGADFLTGRPWPYNGEIDIMEILGRDTSRSYTTLHAPAYNGGGGYGQEHVWTADLSTAFHVYAVEWDSKGMRFFVDSTEVFYASKETVEATRGPWVYDHPFYLILNLAVGGDWPGPPDASTPFPSQMLVDYVHVYQ
ncbi:discoidin domain-containing protein [Micromonospora narathiwatensis]|uniref:Beta-glucanase, GH16 family n=1 Tax=Micromonospora narathiwatensis TaxID=299146 RepID=A0A1A8ZQ95_9ACTN|nr:discoidin domain-containing protein [Micromonospora narathiwatensis]SBT46056.1 Beta-glucanase, GH16 family [Micromonospora narathiwatensis]